MTEYLNGPGLVAWLEEHRRNPYPSETDTGTVRDFLGHSDRRKMRHWRRGMNPSIYSADLLLTKLYVHPSELPEELFVAKKVSA